MIMFGSSLPSALGWLVTTKVYSGTGADIVMESISLTDHVSALSPEKSSCGFRASRRNFLATAHKSPHRPALLAPTPQLEYNSEFHRTLAHSRSRQFLKIVVETLHLFVI